MARSKAEVDKMRAEMKRAVRYRSGPDLINTVYLGGMATAKIMSLLGSNYGEDSLQSAIDVASDGQIEEAWSYDGFQWILKLYRKAGSKLYRFETMAVEID